MSHQEDMIPGVGDFKFKTGERVQSKKDPSRRGVILSVRPQQGHPATAVQKAYDVETESGEIFLGIEEELERT